MAGKEGNCQENRNADVCTDTTATQVTKSNPLIEVPVLSVDQHPSASIFFEILENTKGSDHGISCTIASQGAKISELFFPLG